MNWVPFISPVVTSIFCNLFYVCHYYIKYIKEPDQAKLSSTQISWVFLPSSAKVCLTD